jgi:glycine cleavage system H protein
MNAIPADLKYTKEHEWLKADGKLATVGITFYAQDHLGDVVYVELPPIGKEIGAMEEFGVVESVKSVSSLFCPVSGKVTAVNTELNNNPQLINQDPYGQAWIIKVEMTKPAELNSLLAAADYKKLTEKK